MNRLSGLPTFVKAFIKVSVKLSKTPAPWSDEDEPRCGRVFMVAFQSILSRNMIRSALLRRTGCSARRVRNLCSEFARRDVKSGPNRSPLTYSILCLSGRGGTAHAGYSFERVL
jgi:hypothetical protein